VIYATSTAAHVRAHTCTLPGANCTVTHACIRTGKRMYIYECTHRVCSQQQTAELSRDCARSRCLTIHNHRSSTLYTVICHWVVSYKRFTQQFVRCRTLCRVWLEALPKETVQFIRQGRSALRNVQRGRLCSRGDFVQQRQVLGVRRPGPLPCRHFDHSAAQ
jgi:hypothetical protein